MSTKDSCKFHDIKNNNNNQFNITKKKILIQKNYTKVFVFLLKNCQSEWKIFGVGLVVVVVVFTFWLGQVPFGEFGFWMLVAALCQQYFFLYIFLKLLFILFFLLSSLSVFIQLVLQNNRNSFFLFVDVCYSYGWINHQSI